VSDVNQKIFRNVRQGPANFLLSFELFEARVLGLMRPGTSDVEAEARDIAWVWLLSHDATNIHYSSDLYTLLAQTTGQFKCFAAAFGIG